MSEVLKLPTIPNVQEATVDQAFSWKMLPTCMVAAGGIGVVQGFVLGIMLKDNQSVPEALLNGVLLGVYGFLFGAITGGIWGFLLYLLLFRKTLTGEIFYTIAAMSLLAGVLGALFFHFVRRDAEPISISLIPVATLFGAVAMRIRLAFESNRSRV